MWVNGQINEDWTYTGMLQNEQDFKNDKGDEDTKFQRAYVNGKLGGVKVQAGRYNLNLEDGNVYDERFDGVQASYGKDVKLTAGYGKATPSSVTEQSIGGIKEDGWSLEHEFSKTNDSGEVYYANVTGNVGKLALGAGYYSFGDVTWTDTWGTNGIDEVTDDLDIWSVSAKYAFDKNVTLGALYLKGEDSAFSDAKNMSLDGVDDDGYVVTATYKGAKASQPGSWGLAARYYDQGVNTYVNHTMNGKADNMMGFKGYSVFANYTFAKNIVGQVEWYDLEEKEGDRDSETLWAQMLFTF